MIARAPRVAKLPLPRDVFPRKIETARLSLRKPERREVTFYARQAQEAHAARAEPLSRDQARAFQWTPRLLAAFREQMR